MKVLLVDDEREICMLLASMLARMGIGSHSAYSLAEAREAIEGNAFDLVFLDIHLPDGIGYDLIPVMRRQRHVPKIVAISAVDGEAEKAIRKGADLFLSKPFTRGTILEKIKQLAPEA
ncbi:MAG TPA: response regulator [Flavobacteriales bacterium]|nr:response regulator [Flavobacteriales bacterium]